jgi:hypothetical protein
MSYRSNCEAYRHVDLMPAALRASCFAYRMLLVLYPAELRQRFGEEMIEVFRDQFRDQWMRRPIGCMRVAFVACREIFSVALPSQLQSSVVIAATLSFMSSSALFLGLFRAVSR